MLMSSNCSYQMGTANVPGWACARLKLVEAMHIVLGVRADVLASGYQG